MQRTAIFFSPHPDDIEIGTPFLYLSLLKSGYRVIEILMTDGAFGTVDLNFKGRRLAKIRERELENSNKIFEKATNNHVELVRLNYLDGYLPFNNKLLNQISDIIQHYNPSIIFAPDFWYSQDFHSDHINTGRLIFFSIKKLSSNQPIPIQLFYYYSSAKNRYINIQKDMIFTIIAGLSEHRSQLSPFMVKIIKIFYLIFVLGINFIRFRRWKVGYRTQFYDRHNFPIYPSKFGKETLRNRIKYYLYYNPTLKAYKKLHKVTPSEIDLNIQK
ncbi:MAG: PIG-L family deacetylase [Candidatus Lokiarchaeota archaeon]|nr:PIG-L family deacetylase [Candidatus Lokiarchaeota archaeon]